MEHFFADLICGTLRDQPHVQSWHPTRVLQRYRMIDSSWKELATGAYN